jgi:hypothetical protein
MTDADRPMILRPGAMTKEDLESVIGPVFIDRHLVSSDEVPKAPGMKYKHYSPNEPVIIVDGERNLWEKAIKTYKEQGEKKIKDDKDKFKWIEELKELKDAPEDSKNFINHLKMDFFNDRIFIFTPQGDVVDMPEDSTPIDFAYMIHSDIGDHTSGAKINGKMSPIFSKLKNGDISSIFYETRSDLIMLKRVCTHWRPVNND